MDLPGAIAERKARAMAMILDGMPLFIGEQELIVGSRTLYGHRNEFLDKSDMEILAMPPYLSDRDRAEFGGADGEFFTKAHYTPDFGRILRMGIAGILQTARTAMETADSPLKKGWLQAVATAYEAVSRWVLRYGDYAAALAEHAGPPRRAELQKIAETCRWIAQEPPRDFREAVQLLWFASLATIVENFHWVNYGRLDQILYPYYHTVAPAEARQLIECLMIKMYDGADLKAEYFGAQEGQLNITLGGVTPDGEDAVNPVTMAFLEAAGKIRLPEPQLSCRIHSKNPPEFLRKCAALTVSGLNCIAYYNDDSLIASMTAAGIPVREARNYAFDLCQDMNIPGRGDFYTSGISGSLQGGDRPPYPAKDYGVQPAGKGRAGIRGRGPGFPAGAGGRGQDRLGRRRAVDVAFAHHLGPVRQLPGDRHRRQLVRVSPAGPRFYDRQPGGGGQRAGGAAQTGL